MRGLRSFSCIVLLSLVGLLAFANVAQANPPPCSRYLLSFICTYPMPQYDQTNPNFAAYVSSSTFVQETAPVSNALACGGSTVNNPFDQTWLPFGPIPGDTYALQCGGWWFSAICCPTAEAMALTAAIKNRKSTTTIAGWTANFYNGVAPTIPGNGLTTQLRPIFPFLADPRQSMHAADIQRVIDVALQQGTMPNAGGGADYFTTRGSDFNPAGSGSGGGANQASTIAFIQAMQAGGVIVIGLHDYTAHIASGTVTFTFNGGGHCVAIGGYSVSTALTFFRAPTVEIINPVYGVEQWVTIGTLANGSSTRNGATRTVSLPNGWTSVGFYPDSAHPIGSMWDISDGETITFVDEFHTLTVQ